MNVFTALLLAVATGLVAGQEYQTGSTSATTLVEDASAPNSGSTPSGGVSGSSGSVVPSGYDAIPTTPPPFVTSKPARTFHAVVGRTTGSSTTPTNTGTSESSDSPVSTQDQPSASTDPSIATSDPATTSTPKRTITMKTFRPVVVGMTTNSDPASSTGTMLNQETPLVPATALPLAESATPATFRATIVANGTTNSATTSPPVSTPGANGIAPSNNAITVATPVAPAAAPSTSRNNAGGATVVDGNSPATASTPSATTPATTTRGQSASTGSASTSPSATGAKARPQSSTSTNGTATGQQAAPSVLTNTTATGNQSTTLESPRFGDAVDRANISAISVTKLDDGDGSYLNSSTIFQSSTSGSSGGLNVGNTGNASGNDGNQVESQASGLGMNSGVCASGVGVSAIWAMMVLVVLW